MRASKETLNKDADSLTKTSPARITAVCLGLGGFSIGLLGGLASGAEADQILFRAVVSLFVCYMVGYVMGLVGERVADDAARRCIRELSARAHGTTTPADASATVNDLPADMPSVEAVN